MLKNTAKLSLAQSFDSDKLKKWFYLSRRPLPWRENPSPYEVWISEVMLQQTQVSVVIPYFKRWMTLFPSISTLASAPIEEVIKVWEGLGYYSRARNLHAGAQYLTKYHGGELPNSPEALKKVKGLGPYTIGAILSFAFKGKVPAIDGNVLRVLSRFFAIEEAIDQTKTQTMIRELCETLLPEDEPWIVMEGLIELGALVCQKKAKCELCPLNVSCLGKSKADLLPIKKKREKTTHLYRDIAIVRCGNDLLLRKGKKGKIMADLWEFPYVERGMNIEEVLGIPLTLKGKLDRVIHTFTRYKAFLHPYLYQAAKEEIEGYQWVSLSDCQNLPFSSGHRKILKIL